MEKQKPKQLNKRKSKAITVDLTYKQDPINAEHLRRALDLVISKVDIINYTNIQNAKSKQTTK